MLSARWRVIDDPVQWILQQRERKEVRRRRDGTVRGLWKGRSFPMTRAVLNREICRLCSAVDPDAIKRVALLPEKHPGFVAHVEKNLAQYRKENPRAGRGRARPGDLKGVPVPGKDRDDERAAPSVSRVA